MLSIRISLIAAAIVSVGAAPAQARDKQLERLLALTPDGFAATVKVKDDRLETVAEINTLEGFQHKQGLLGIVWDDVFMRGYIDKKTGKVTNQIYAVLVWQGSGWPFFRTVNVALPSGTEAFELTRVGSNVDCSGSRYLGCTYTEHVIFALNNEQVQSIGATFVPGSPNGIAMRFKGQGGVDRDAVVMPAEAAGYSRVMQHLVQRYPGIGASAAAENLPMPSTEVPRVPPAPAGPAKPTPVPATKTPPKEPKPAIQCITCR